jgi:HEAT repeat protein
MPLVRKPPSGPRPAAAPATTAGVLELLVSGTDEQRWSAARAAAELPDSIPALGEALARERSSTVRQALFTALARIATPQSVETILPFLRSDDALVRTGATDALRAMKDVAWPHVAKLLRDPDTDVRILACGLVRDMPTEISVGLYCDVLDSEQEPNVCAAAVDALAEIGAARALPALTRCAERFHATPFLVFSIQVAADRIRSHVPRPRG